MQKITEHKRELISQVMEIEWAMFSSVKNRGGRASCQESPETFRIIRTSTFEIWSEDTLESYLSDLENINATGRNIMTEKYARMEGVYSHLDPEVQKLIDQIVDLECRWAEDLLKKYPDAKLGRPIYSSQDTPYVVSSETYSRGELATYSKKTLELYHQDNLIMESEKLNRIELAAIGMSAKFAEKQ